MGEKVNMELQEGVKEPTIEEVKAQYFNLLEQYKKLQAEASARLREANMFNAFKRLEFLFKVTEHAELYSSEFLNNVIKEIEETLNPKEESSKEE